MYHLNRAISKSYYFGNLFIFHWFGPVVKSRNFTRQSLWGKNLTLSLTRTHTNTHTRIQTHAHTHTHTRTHTHTHSHMLISSVFLQSSPLRRGSLQRLSLFLLTHSLSLTHAHIFSLSQTHTPYIYKNCIVCLLGTEKNLIPTISRYSCSTAPFFLELCVWRKWCSFFWSSVVVFKTCKISLDSKHL